MKLNEIGGRIKSAVGRMRDAVVQDCPPELAACEVCGELECSTEQWINCERRLRAADYLRSHSSTVDSDEGTVSKDEEFSA